MASQAASCARELRQRSLSATMCQGGWSTNTMQRSDKYGNPPPPIRTVTHVVPSEHPATAAVYTNDFLREPSKAYAAVFRDLQPLTFVLKVTGLLPLYAQISAYELASPTRTHAYYTLAMRLAVCALTIFYLYILFAPVANKVFYSYSGDTVNVNQYIEILLCVLTYATTVLITAKNAKPLLAILNELLKVDEEVRQRFSVTLRTQCAFVWKFMVGIVVCQCYMLVLNVMQLPVPFDLYVGVLLGFYALQNCLSAFFIVYAAALLRIVTRRFVYVNVLLTGYTYGEQRKWQQQRRVFVRRNGDVLTASMENFPDDSLFSYRMHNKLLRIYKAMNDCCSLILVAYMGYAFYSITTNTYNLFVLITSGGFSMSVLQWGLAWLALHISLLALLSRSCGNATKQANITSQILARIYDKNKDCQNIIDKFLTKSIKQEVQFTAYGFFVIDNSTLFKIFSAVTTYLVILIQFRQLEDSKSEDQTATTT